MVVRSHYFDGEPCWADVVAPDMEAARRFYGAVFGWTFVDAPQTSGRDVLCLQDDEPVAALRPPMPDAGEPAVWTTYLSTPDAATAADRIGPAGGQVLRPAETVSGGRTLMAADPDGAVFGIRQPAGSIGARLYGQPGAITWAEVSTRAPGDVDAFYRGLFGVEPVGWGDVPGEDTSDVPAEQAAMDYVVYTGADAGPALAGRLTMTADFGDVPSRWTIYFNVDDADDAADRVTAARGQVVVAPFDTPYGRMTLAADPHGAVLGLSAAAIASARLASWT
jgi:uncharacterized protein